MKRAIMITAAVAAIAVIGFFVWKSMAPKGPKVSQPFTFEVPFEADTVKAYLEVSDIRALAASSPFHFGPAGPGQHTQEYLDARRAKVEELIADSDRLAETAMGLKPNIEKMRKAVYDYLQACVKAEPKSEEYARATAGMMVKLQTQEALAEVNYQSVDTRSDSEFTRTFMEFAKFTSAIELADLYLRDVYNMTVSAALGMDALSKNSNPAIAEAGRKLDRGMGVYDRMSRDLAGLAAGVGKISYGLKQLKTGDYYFAKSAVEFMRASIPGLKQKLIDTKPNKDLPVEAIEVAKAALVSFDFAGERLQSQLDSYPKADLLPASEFENARVPLAYAEERATDYTSAYKAVAAPNNAPEPQEGWLAKGWRTLVKQPVHAVQSVVGYGMDGLGATIRSGAQTGMSFYYGGTWGDLWKDVKGNFSEVQENWRKDMSGVSSMRTAKEYFDAVDQTAEDYSAAGAEKLFGKGWTSWGIGKVANATSSLFTGLGKGISLVGNRQADTVDYIQGGIEIASSAIGGSKVILRGSQVPGLTKGLAEGGMLTAQRMWNAAGKLFTKMEQREIDDLIRICIKNGFQLGSLNGRKAVVEATLATIQATNAQIRTRLGELASAAVSAAGSNAAVTFRNSIEDFVKKQFARNMSGVYKAVKTALGGNAKDYVDSVIGQWVETALKDMIDQIWRESPLAQEMKGTWTGTTTFTSIQVPETSASAKSQGCDFSGLVKALQGKALPTQMVMDGNPSGAGSMTLLINAGKNKSPANARYTYKDGAVTINQGLQGMALSMNGRAIRQDKGYVMNGSISLAGGKEGAKLTMTGVWKVKK